MTKLMEWLSAFLVIFTIWWSVITKKIDNRFTKQHYDTLIFSPVYLIISFGVYAVSVVLYRTLTFNSCEDAAIEIQNEIIEAKSELAKLGYNFKVTTNSEDN